MIESMDTQIRRVIEALDANGLTENTIVIITSDNGGERFSDTWPFTYREDDFFIKDYRFASGEVLPELRLHYRTMGCHGMTQPGRSSTACCCCRATPGPSPIGCAPRSSTSCTARGSRSMRPSTSVLRCPTSVLCGQIPRFHAVHFCGASRTRKT